MVMSAAIFMLTVCVSDIMKKAGMGSTSVYYIKNQLFSLLLIGKE